jgi:hypothetical protein
MSADKIVVIVLAVLFFGGVFLLALKNRQTKGEESQQSPTPATPTKDEGVSPFQSKDRRKPK